MLVALGATANHCAFYLMSSSTVEAHKDELKAYDHFRLALSESSWRLGSRRTWDDVESQDRDPPAAQRRRSRLRAPNGPVFGASVETKSAPLLIHVSRSPLPQVQAAQRTRIPSQVSL